MKIRITNCAWCGEEFRRPVKPGRPPKYCSDEHRLAYLREVAQPAWQRREQRKRVARNVW